MTSVQAHPANPLLKIPRRRWGIAALLGFGVLVNYFDRVNLSVSRDALQDAFGISAVMFGYLSSAYNWTYALLQLPSGLLLDRFGVRRVGIVSTIIWSVASFAAAISSRIGALFASRLLLGIGEAPTFPAYAKATGYWFPKDERSLATAMFDSAAKFSSALGVPVLGLVLVHFGWRWNFAGTGLISVLFFALFYVYYRNPSDDKLLSRAEREYIARGGAQPEDRERAAKGAPLAYLLQQRRVWGLALGFASYNYSFYLLLAWLPSYLSTTHHIDLLRSALYTSVPWIIATVLDLAVGGWLVDALIQRGRNPVRVRQAVLIGGTALGLGHRRLVRGVPGGMVNPLANCSERKRWHCRRNPEFLQSALRNSGSDCYRLRGAGDALVFLGLRGRRYFPADRNRRLRFPLGINGACAGASLIQQSASRGARNSLSSM